MSFKARERRTRVREKPRMSSPKLGEYLNSSRAGRRERIIHDQKFVSDFMVVRYASAEQAIRVALLSEDTEKRIDDGLRNLRARATRTTFQDDAKRNCIDALHAFAKLLPDLALDGVRVSTTGQPTFAQMIESVVVSSRPLVLLSRENKDGSVQRGALQIVLRKEAVLDDRGGEAVALILKEALCNAGHINVSPKLCMVLDVFGGKVFCAPTRSSRLLDDIKSACREIAVRWPAVAA